MKNYFILFYTFLLWLFIEISTIPLNIITYPLYPFIYPFRNTWLRKYTPFWLFFNDSEDGDFGDPRWQAMQKKPKTKLDWFVLSYRWNVRRNPAWNYIGRVLNTTKPFNSPITLAVTNPNITARYSTAFHRGYGTGYGLFLFKVGNYWRFAYSNLFEVGKYSFVVKMGFNEFRPMFKLAWVKTINIKKVF